MLLMWSLTKSTFNQHFVSIILKLRRSLCLSYHELPKSFSNYFYIGYILIFIENEICQNTRNKQPIFHGQVMANKVLKNSLDIILL